MISRLSVALLAFPFAPQDPASTWEWVRWLGGWAVVVVVLQWFMKRSAERDASRDKSFEELLQSMRTSLEIHREATTHFSEVRAEEDRVHSEILRALMSLAQSQEILTQSVQRLAEKVDGRA